VIELEFLATVVLVTFFWAVRSELVISVSRVVYQFLRWFGWFLISSRLFLRDCSFWNLRSRWTFCKGALMRRFDMYSLLGYYFVTFGHWILFWMLGTATLLPKTEFSFNSWFNLWYTRLARRELIMQSSISVPRSSWFLRLIVKKQTGIMQLRCFHRINCIQVSTQCTRWLWLRLLSFRIQSHLKMIGILIKCVSFNTILLRYFLNINIMRRLSWKIKRGKSLW